MPSPAVRTSARSAPNSASAIRFVEHHVVAGEAAAPRGAAGTARDTTRGCSRARRVRAPAPCPWMPGFAALDLDEHADRRLVDRDDRRLRARTPRGTSRSGTRREGRARSRTRSSSVPSPTTVSSSSRTFMSAGLHRPLERQPALAVLHADAQHAAAASQRSSSVSSRTSSCRRRPSSGVAPAARMAARASSADANRSLISRSRVVVDTGGIIQAQGQGSGRLEPARGSGFGARGREIGAERRAGSGCDPM